MNEELYFAMLRAFRFHYTEEGFLKAMIRYKWIMAAEEGSYLCL